MGKLLVQKTDSTSWQTGNTQLILLANKADIKKISAGAFPFGFNYAHFMAHHNIYQQINLDKIAYRTKVTSSKSIIMIAHKIREHIKKYFKKNGLDSTSYDLAVALLLGEKQTLSSDIYSDFKVAGTVHILAISGLHIGILLIFLNFLFKPLKLYSKWLFLALVLSILWFYAFLTGFSPSVLRAVIMFSFLQIGLMSKHRVNIYNSLFMAAFFMFLLNPNNIFDVGFQMSFAAVLSIISFYPIFSSWFLPHYKILKWLTDLFWVSLSAQLGVLPLTLYYFHQFPLYFFLANLLVIPLLFIILFVGFSLILLSFTPFKITLIFQMFSFLLQVLILINQTIAHWPYAVIRPIRISAIQFISLFAGLFLLYYFFKNRSNYKAWLLLGLWIINFQLISIYRNYNNSKTYYVFHQYKNALSGLTTGYKMRIYSDSYPLNRYFAYNLSSYFKIVDSTSIPFMQNINRHKVMHIDKLGIYKLVNAQPEIVVVHHSPKINADRMLRFLKPKLLIMDGSNYPSVAKAFEKSAKRFKVRFYNTAKQGTFTLK